MQVVNRKGEREDVRFDAILDKLRNLSDGLDPNWIDPAHLTKLTIEGLYDGVTTRELDQLAAETAASLVSHHPDYSKLAARICVDDLHRSTKDTFTDVITDLREYIDPESKKHAPLISEEVYEIIMANAEVLNNHIDYTRDYNYDYFGFKTLERSYLLKLNGEIAERPQHMLLSRAIERAEIERLAKDRDDEQNILEGGYLGRMMSLLNGQDVASGPKDLPTDTRLTPELLDNRSRHQVSQVAVKDDAVQKKIEAQNANFEQAIKSLDGRFSDKVDKLQRGDEVMPGVMKMVKVFVAVKRKLQPGDKMAGRHGNKGVISRIMPSEDMPYLEDGTPVDIVLNPLGVPSRMNVGQILETHLGWAARGLGEQIGAAAEAAHARGDVKDLHKQLKQVFPADQYKDNLEAMDDNQVIEQANLLARGVPMATPVFDGAREADVTELLEMAGLSNTGQERLIDGRTGEYFDRAVTVGYIYMLKL